MPLATPARAATSSSRAVGEPPRDENVERGIEDRLQPLIAPPAGAALALRGRARLRRARPGGPGGRATRPLVGIPKGPIGRVGPGRGDGAGETPGRREEEGRGIVSLPMTDWSVM